MHMHDVQAFTSHTISPTINYEVSLVGTVY